MADEGLLTITFTITKNKRLIGNVVVKSSGFADFESSKSLENSIRQKTLDFLLIVLKNIKILTLEFLKNKLLQDLVNLFIKRLNEDLLLYLLLMLLIIKK